MQLLLHKWNKLYVTATLKVTVVVKPENAQCNPHQHQQHLESWGDSRYHGENSTNATSDFSTWWPLISGSVLGYHRYTMHSISPRIAKPGSPPFEKSNLVAPHSFYGCILPFKSILHYRNQTRRRNVDGFKWKRNWKGIAKSHDISQGYSIWCIYCVTCQLYLNSVTKMWANDTLSVHVQWSYMPATVPDA